MERRERDSFFQNDTRVGGLRDLEKEMDLHLPNDGNGVVEFPKTNKGTSLSDLPTPVSWYEKRVSDDNDR